MVAVRHQRMKTYSKVTRVRPCNSGDTGCRRKLNIGSGYALHSYAESRKSVRSRRGASSAVTVLILGNGEAPW